MTVDERYCDLEVAPQSDVLLLARHAGGEHPVVWTAPKGGDACCTTPSATT